jgi:hypothetical protein
MIAFLIAAIAGTLFGLVLKVFVLVPATIIAMVAITVIGLASGLGLGMIVLIVIGVSASLQIGYLAGCVLRVAAGAYLPVPTTMRSRFSRSKPA